MYCVLLYSMWWKVVKAAASPSALLSPTVSGVEWAVERSLSPPFSPPLIAVAALPPSLSVLIDCVSGEKGGRGLSLSPFYSTSVVYAPLFLPLIIGGSHRMEGRRRRS